MIELVFFDDKLIDKEIRDKLVDMNEADLRNLILHLVNKNSQLKKHILKY